MNVPTLPVAGLRALVQAGDWDAASHLIDLHHRELTEALAARDQGTCSSPPAEWVELLLAQRAMLEELRCARDDAASSLARLGSNRRGARAYLQQEVA